MISYTDPQIITSLLLATRYTLVLFVVGAIGGGLLALVLLMMGMSSNRLMQRILALYVTFFQGTPLLMQLYLLFFGIAYLGVLLPAWAAAAIALIAWSAAFLSEIWRGCVAAVPRGQWEASSSLAMSYVEQMRYVVLPQAFSLAIGPTVGFLVDIMKATAVTAIIGYVELFQAGNAIANTTFQPFKVYGFVAIIYFLLCWPVSIAARRIEEKYSVSH
ncbi:amino acid ABC transporter permease [Sagittula stellata]|uniref:ABC transporter, membrane spanning protein n=1 Tax=Sagittula stellata (strain ATCC 700073 / DSM 11524 / E-37) TaxID=388399 RepID=A3K4F7_SAGS3|nr:amino acid ABC transporter permease [Sagittula stellata]EBA07856.1 ABC transporter, membrane spanning protein [Sagittula stellata E-37]